MPTPEEILQELKLAREKRAQLIDMSNDLVTQGGRIQAELTEFKAHPKGLAAFKQIQDKSKALKAIKDDYQNKDLGQQLEQLSEHIKQLEKSLGIEHSGSLSPPGKNF